MTPSATRPRSIVRRCAPRSRPICRRRAHARSASRSMCTGQTARSWRTARAPWRRSRSGRARACRSRSRAAWRLPTSSIDELRSARAHHGHRQAGRRSGATTPLYAGSYSLVTAVQGEALVVPRPSTTSAGALMLAMVVARDTADTNLISIAAGAGQLDPADHVSEQHADQCARCVVLEAREQLGVLELQLHPHQQLARARPHHGLQLRVPEHGVRRSPLGGQTAAPGPLSIGMTHTNVDGDLVVIGAACPDDFSVIFTTPAGINSRASVVARSCIGLRNREPRLHEPDLDPFFELDLPLPLDDNGHRSAIGRSARPESRPETRIVFLGVRVSLP